MDLVLKARGNMQPDRADGLEDMTVAEMLKELLADTMYEFTQWFERRFRGGCEAPSSWMIVKAATGI